MVNFDKYDEPRLHMDRLLNARLIEFDLSARIVYPLDSHGVKTLGDLIKWSRKEIRRIKRIGVASVRRIERLMTRYNLKLRE